MSVLPSVLWWAGDYGEARHDGVTLALRFCPILPGLQHVTRIDFAPRLRALIAVDGRERVMTDVERRQCSTILRRVAFSARAELLQPIGPDLGEEL